MKPAWRIYYADGSTWSSLDGPVGSAPRFGVVCVAFCDETGLCIAHGQDWFVLREDGGWTAHDDLGLAHVLRDIKKLDAILVGTQVRDRVYEAVYTRAATDPDFCATSGTRLAHLDDGTKVVLRRQPDGSLRGFVQ